MLATLGIRYLPLDNVDLSMAAIVVNAAAGAAARLFHDEAVVEMNTRAIATEAKLLRIGIPVLLGMIFFRSITWCCRMRRSSSPHHFHGLSKTIILETNALTLRICVRPQAVAIAPKSSSR